MCVPSDGHPYKHPLSASIRLIVYTGCKHDTVPFDNTVFLLNSSIEWQTHLVKTACTAAVEV